MEKLEEMGLTQGEEDELLDASPTHGTPRVTVTKSAAPAQVYKADINYNFKYSAKDIIPVLAKLSKGDAKRELIKILRTVRDQAKQVHWLWELLEYNLRTSPR
jgi:hypothetical protein